MATNGKADHRADRGDRRRGIPPRAKGLSLIEVVISSLIVATMLVAALGAVSAATKSLLIQSDRCLGPNLARQLMSEVLQAHYVEPTDAPKFGRESGEARKVRTAWDDVDDYNRWSASPPQAKDGTVLTHADGWTRKVVVKYAQLSDPRKKAQSDEGLKRIIVTVTSPTGKTHVLNALRCESSIYDQRPDSTTTYVGAVNVSLQIGKEEATRVSSGTNLLNPLPASP